MSTDNLEGGMRGMDAKESVKKSIEYIKEVFSDEKIDNIGLEELSYDEGKGCWYVTIGFSRDWDYPEQSPMAKTLYPFPLPKGQPTREYKTVEIRDADGEVLGVRIRVIDSEKCSY